MDKYGVVRLCKYIRSDGTDQPGKIGRTAGAAKPLLANRFHMFFPAVLMACLRNHFQRIHVEKAGSLQSHAAQDYVVELALHDIRILRVRTHPQHSLREEDHSDGGAGLRVRRVIGQIVGKGKRLADVCAADPAGDVHLRLRDIVPELLASRLQRLVRCESCKVRHSRIEIDCPHRMSRRLGLLPHREMCLMVLIAKFFLLVRAHRMLRVKVIRSPAPLIDKVQSQIPVLLLPRHLIQLCQRHLRDLMSRISAQSALLRADVRRNTVRIPARRIQ